MVVLAGNMVIGEEVGIIVILMVASPLMILMIIIGVVSLQGYHGVLQLVGLQHRMGSHLRTRWSSRVHRRLGIWTVLLPMSRLTTDPACVAIERCWARINPSFVTGSRLGFPCQWPLRKMQGQWSQASSWRGTKFSMSSLRGQGWGEASDVLVVLHVLAVDVFDLAEPCPLVFWWVTLELLLERASKASPEEVDQELGVFQMTLSRQVPEAFDVLRCGSWCVGGESQCEKFVVCIDPVAALIIQLPEASGEVAPIMEQHALTVLIYAELTFPPFTGSAFKLSSCVVNHGRVIMHTIGLEPGIGLEDEDVNISSVELGERGLETHMRRGLWLATCATPCVRHGRLGITGSSGSGILLLVCVRLPP